MKKLFLLAALSASAPFMMSATHQSLPVSQSASVLLVAAPQAPQAPTITFTEQTGSKDSLLSAPQHLSLTRYFEAFNAFADQAEAEVKNRKLKATKARPTLPAINAFPEVAPADLPQNLRSSRDKYHLVKENERKNIEATLKAMEEYVTEKVNLLK